MYLRVQLTPLSFKMEVLINKVRDVSLDKQSIDDLVDNLGKVSILGKRKMNMEYTIFKINYHKLQMIHSFIMKFPERSEIESDYSIFLEYIDRKTQQYLMEIDWEIDEYLVESQEIANLFFRSLASNNPFDKMQYTLDAYSKIEKILA